MPLLYQLGNTSASATPDGSLQFASPAPNRLVVVVTPEISNEPFVIRLLAVAMPLKSETANKGASKAQNDLPVLP